MTSLHKIKTSELIGPALDWAVAKARNATIEIQLGEGVESKFVSVFIVPGSSFDPVRRQVWCPSTSWAQGGPIIRQERMLVRPCAAPCDGQWAAKPWDETVEYVFGPTLLIAAMRCYVISKLGDEVEIPKELE